MRIAICDDDLSELNQISSFLNLYRQEKSVCLTYQVYQSAADLLPNLKSGQYDLLLLDIVMPGFTGMQAAHEVRGFDCDVKIVFITASPEFALDSYAVKAWDYILKPISKDMLFCVLDAVFAQEQTPLDGLFVKTQNGMARFLFSKLAFVEVLNKHLFFHLADGSVREACAPLSEYEKQLLARPEFVKVHRSYIVNLWQMSELFPNRFVAQNGQVIPISRLLYSQVRRVYMEHLFVEAGSN
ncbi:MAG: LytTR family DNA-binding domain-containing protein [Christensenella sp.]